MDGEKSELLLFNKEVAPRGFKYRLYFVTLPSLKERSPRIQRLVCTRSRYFKDASLGKVYDVTCRQNILKTLYETGEEILSEEDYANLISEKERLFYRAQPATPFRPLYSNAYNGCYYAFDDVKRITSYREDAFPSVMYSTLYALCHLLCLVIPFAAFAWSIFAVAQIPRASLIEYWRRFWLLPVYYFAAVPFMIYLMTLFWAFTDTALLKRDCFKWRALKRHAYTTGGMRKGTSLHAKQKTRLIKYGLVTGGLYFITLLLVLL